MADEGRRASEAVLAAFEDEIREIYRKAAQDAADALSSFLEDFSERDEAMRAAVEAGEMDRGEWMRWRKSKMTAGKRLSDVLEQMSDGVARADQTAVEILGGKLPSVAAENANWAAYEVESAAGLSTGFALQDADTVATLLSDAGAYLPRPRVDLPKDARWSRKRMRSAITQGVLLGESIPKIARRVASATDANRNAAVRTARTCVTAAECAGRVASYSRADGMGIVLKQEWLAAIDGRTRHSHMVLDGERIEVGGTFSNGCRYPGDPEAPYAETMNCRCTLVAAVDGVDQDEAARWSKLPDGMSYGEWKTGKSEATVVGIKQRKNFAERVKRAFDEISESNRVLKFSAFNFEKPKRDGIRLGKKEYARVMSAINTNYKSRFSGKRSATIAVGNYVYRFEITEFDEYRFISREKLK